MITFQYLIVSRSSPVSISGIYEVVVTSQNGGDEAWCMAMRGGGADPRMCDCTYYSFVFHSSVLRLMPLHL